MTGDLSTAFKALGHPHRLALVQRLLEEAIACETSLPDCCGLDSACCNFSSLVEELDVGKSTVSHHLKELHRAGLIERKRNGRRVYCRISEGRLSELRSFLEISSDQ